MSLGTIRRGIPCHHAIAFCRANRINPESLVHSCYTIDTYLKAYQFKLVPLRGRVFWEKMNGVVIHPPLFTKVMGRPKKNRRKAPEEKIKNGVKRFTKSGVTIHCSICGVADHNKKGHAKYVESQLEQQQPEHVQVEAAEMDYMQHLHVQPQNPTLDPSHQLNSMVYNLEQEAQQNVPMSRYHGPLPESAFVDAARESIPQARVRITTTTTRGRGRARGRSAATTPATREEEPQTEASRGIARGRTATTGQATEEMSNRGRGKGKKSKAAEPDEQQGNRRVVLDLNAEASEEI